MVDSKKIGPPKNEWRTPPEFVKQIEDYFKIKFTLDPCAAKDNHLKIENTITESEDGLIKNWHGVVWVNPPYDTKWIWVRKAFLEMCKRGADCWVLMEACTDTIQFHSWVPCCEVYLLRGRIKFLGDDLKPFGNGMRGSMLLHFSNNALPLIHALTLGENQQSVSVVDK